MNLSLLGRLPHFRSRRVQYPPLDLSRLCYLGLAALKGVLLLAVAVEAPLFAALGQTAVAAFAVSDALHYHGERVRLGNLEKPPEPRKRE